MASKPSDLLDLVACLHGSALRGDWKSAGELAAILPQQILPESREELGEYLVRLKEALIAAKASRANAAASLAKFNTAVVRLNAAATFNKTRRDFASSRQHPGETTDFWRTHAPLIEEP